MAKRKIAVLTINFNTEHLIERFIDSIRVQSYDNWFLIIANNSVTDDILQKVKAKFPDLEIHILNINENIGYSKANNFSFAYLIKNFALDKRDLVLFSNEDIVIDDKDFFKKSVEYFDRYNCSFLGPQIINNDGSMMLPHKHKTGFLKCLLHFGNNGIPDKIFRINSYFKKIKNPEEVFLINGACFFCSYNDFLNAGMFDGNTFIYYAEELLFRKVEKAGMQVFYIPDLYVKHDHSGAVKKNYNPVFKKNFVYEAELYFLKNILKINRFLLALFKAERRIEFFFLFIFKKALKN